MSATRSPKLKKLRSKKLPYKPKKHQERAIRFAMVQPTAGIVAAPGAGKTGILYELARRLREKKKIRNVLVVSKTRALYGPWPKELAKWNFPFKLVYLHGPERNDNLRQDGDVYLTNYESLILMKDKLPYFISSKGIDLICFDESTKMKGAGSKRFKFIKKIVSMVPRRMLLTGSLNPNSYEDLWSQIYLLDLGASLGENITRYRLEYFVPSGYKGYGWSLAEGADKTIAKKIKHLLIRIESDQLDLPPINHVTRIVDLPPKAMKIYRELEKEFITEVENHGVIVASTAGAASMKLRQVCSGAVYTGSEYESFNKRKVAHIHDEKLDELEELVNELGGEPLLVGYEFQHEKPRIMERFPNAVYFGVGVSYKEGSLIEDAWNRGDIPILVGNAASIGHALNMQEHGCHIAFFTSTFNFENNDQFIRRIWRPGQKRPVTVHRIIARGTVDERVAEVLARKEADQKSLWSMLEEHYGR